MIDPTRVAELRDSVREALVETGLPSCQMALAHRGELVCYETFGEAAHDSRFPLFSCTKPIVAAGIWLLLGRGELRLDEPVASRFPEFGATGKQAVTVEHLLTHTAGFPRAPLGPPAWFDRAARVARMASWRIDWEPGSRCDYHATSAHWVLAELIERVSGEDYRDFVNRRVLEPMGLRRLRLGVPIALQADINDVRISGERLTPGEMERRYGIRLELPEITDQTLLRFNEPEVRALGVPGAGAMGTAAELALFYQGLLQDRAGIFDAAVLADATCNPRARHPDAMSGMPANRSVGLVIKGDDAAAARRGMGKRSSAGSFGHPGVGGQLAWADPATGLSFALLTNGLDLDMIAQARRGHRLSDRATACVTPGAGAR